MGRTKTDSEFIIECGNEFVPLDKYDGANNPIRIKHIVCGYIHETTPHNFFKRGGPHCIKCNKRIRRTTKTFIAEVYTLVGNEYQVVGEFKNVDTKLIVRHTHCGYEWEVRPRHFISGMKSRCPNCYGHIKLTNEQFVARARELVSDEYTFLEPYQNADKPLQVQHRVCGTIYTVAPSNFWGGDRCAFCVRKKLTLQQRKSFEQYVAEVHELGNGEFTVESKYMGSFKPITIRHERCNQVFTLQYARNFLKYPGCRHCTRTESKGERLISDYLRNKGLTFLREVRFRDCKDKNVLKFDFGILHDNRVIGLIEFDGQQHYFPVGFFGGAERFTEQLRRDEIKNIFVQKRHIPLLRIGYHQLEHVQVIDKFVFDLGCFRTDCCSSANQEHLSSANPTRS